MSIDYYLLVPEPLYRVALSFLPVVTTFVYFYTRTQGCNYCFFTYYNYLLIDVFTNHFWSFRPFVPITDIVDVF